MQSTYNVWLVALSLGVAMLASYTTLDILGRISGPARPLHRWPWLAGGALSMGVGIWSMHFIGMLAFSLPMPLGYDFAITAESLGIAIGVSFAALYLVTCTWLNRLRFLIGGVVLGSGIAMMHYTGMAALQMEPSIRYRPIPFIVSIVIAISAAIAALWTADWLGRQSPDNQRHVAAKQIAASAMMGFAIAGMHYTGMSAAVFRAGSVCGAANRIDRHWLAVAVALATLGMLGMTLLFSRLNASKTAMQHFAARLNGQLVRLATFDSLTDLPNRATFIEQVNWAIDKSQRTQLPFAVFFMDIDGFKIINDSLGHAVGDSILKAFAQRLRMCVRGSDTVARLGGDEFVILFEGLSSERDAQTVAQNILDTMRESLSADGVPLSVTTSIGIALYPGDGETVDLLLRNADVAMYVAKQGGRNTYRFFEATMGEAATRMLQIQRALHEGLDAGYLSLEFQPKFNGNDGELAGAEALLRLNHPMLGIVEPLEFIPVAERSGQILSIGYWVVRETCRHIRRWTDEQLLPIKISINLSPQQVQHLGLVGNMCEILAEEGVPNDRLMFEITETVAMQDAPRTVVMIDELQQCGFDVAIDDFGTGYSSLAYLQRFRVKQLKIDRFFTNGLDTHGEEGHAIVSAIISLAHTLKIGVVAEGVESESQLDKLKALRCDQMQGFLLARPLSSDAFVTFVKATAQVA